ncbi:MAG: restriction endonuclease subunit S [Burkholderiaceae bacterium]|nr:restriction endonuclease subunit S [Burkholderiaceae bacterium]
MKAWPRVALGELLQDASEPVRVQQDAEYPNFGIYSFGRGLFAKPPISGMQTSAGTLYRVRAGNFIYSRLFAFEGSYGLVDDAFDGHFTSNEYPSFSLDRSRLEPAFLKAYFQLPRVWQGIAMGSKGVGSRRIRVQPDKVLAHRIPLPPLAEQQAIVARLDALAAKTREVETHLDAIERDADRLVRSYIFHSRGEQHIKRPMSELVQQRPTDISVDRTTRYRFAGVYSFGRGVFPSVVKAGSEFAYERLSTVRAGDFTYPKLMAWEGALGVVPPACDGMVVSPEFPVFTVDTDEVLPEVLDIYFRTPEVWPALAELSGGTNVRRRRLQPSSFLGYEMPVPSKAAQLKVRAAFRHVQLLKAKHTAIREANALLLPATLERVFVQPQS